MSGPLVSIIIPVYNGENYLKDAIDSALAQTYPHIEVIVINDGSRDQGGTERVALSYGDRIRYFHKENGGVATALNLGIRQMKGDYFSWLSHDDMYTPDKVEKQIQSLRDHGNMTAVVFSDYDLLDVNTNKIAHVELGKKCPADQLTKSVLPVLQNLIHGCSLLIHKQHFERVGVFDEKLVTTQDYDLWFRMMRHQKLVYIPQSLVISRLHEAQGSRTISRHHLERNELHLRFLIELSEKEMTDLYGNPYNFYHRMCSYFKGEKMMDSYRVANRKLQETEIPPNLSEQLSILQQHIQDLSNSKAHRLCIFGAGEYGMRLYQELRCRLIQVDCFSDNNQAKWGYLFDHVQCISPDKLKEEKDRMLVIVANRSPSDIVDQLRAQGFPYIATKQELDKVFYNVPPVKWITTLDAIEDMDYSSKDVQLLIERFNQTIFDVCKYYQDRVK